MAYKLVLTLRAEAHLEDIIKWYSHENDDLTKRFIKELDLKFSLLELNPLFFQKIHKDFRSATTGKFPYKIIYKIHKLNVVVVAIVHHKRHPKVWVKSTK